MNHITDCKRHVLVAKKAYSIQVKIHGYEGPRIVIDRTFVDVIRAYYRIEVNHVSCFS